MPEQGPFRDTAPVVKKVYCLEGAFRQGARIANRRLTLATYYDRPSFFLRVSLLIPSSRAASDWFSRV
jgi:hypothetical protein